MSYPPHHALQKNESAPGAKAASLAQGLMAGSAPGEKSLRPRPDPGASKAFGAAMKATLAPKLAHGPIPLAAFCLGTQPMHAELGATPVLVVDAHDDTLRVYADGALRRELAFFSRDDIARLEVRRPPFSLPRVAFLPPAPRPPRPR